MEKFSGIKVDVEEFDEVLDETLKEIKSTLGSKAAEYVQGNDRLYNFNRAAEILRSSSPIALLGMQMKHITSYIDLLENPESVTKELVKEKTGDMICYTILAKVMLYAIARKNAISKSLEDGELNKETKEYLNKEFAKVPSYYELELN